MESSTISEPKLYSFLFTTFGRKGLLKHASLAKVTEEECKQVVHSIIKGVLPKRDVSKFIRLKNYVIAEEFATLQTL